jgi:acetyltransferase-like isoleucine patch superfamily enzyme
MSLFIGLLLLKFIVGSATSGYYPLNSHYYLQKLWLRQLIITSFHHSLNFVPSNDVLPLNIFRWLGVNIADGVELVEIQQILRCPSNLLNIEHGLTTFTGATLASFEMTKEGLCYLDEIHLDSGINLGNWCTIMPGTRIPSEIIVGSLTLVKQTTVSDHFNSVLLGIPACEMPFAMPDHPSITNDMASASSLSICGWLLICLSFFISKCFPIIVYSSLPLVIALFVHLICGCALYRYSISARRRSSHFQFSEVVTHLQHFLYVLISDFFVFLYPYLSGTQFLVFLFRVFGAQIGSDVIISDDGCVVDPQLVSIGDHVRLHRHARIQVRHIYFRHLFI